MNLANIAHEMAEVWNAHGCRIPRVADPRSHDQMPNQVCRMAISRNLRIFGQELGIASGVINFTTPDNWHSRA